MRKFFAAIFVMIWTIIPVGWAEVPDVDALTDEECQFVFGLIADRLGTVEINRMLGGWLPGYSDEELTVLKEMVLAEEEARGISEELETLQRGSKGDKVVELQKRLIELNYLSGSADGDYGGKTESAIKLFQEEAGLTVSGIADEQTQSALYADDAPKATVYLDLDYTALSRDPDKYIYNSYKFNGKVLQVMEDEYEGSTIVAMRVATKGNYDNVVYVIYVREEGESRILEDDRITVYASSTGLYTYETVMGAEISIPGFRAEIVNLQ